MRLAAHKERETPYHTIRQNVRKISIGAGRAQGALLGRGISPLLAKGANSYPLIVTKRSSRGRAPLHVVRSN